MNLDMLIALAIKLMGASSYDELTEHNLTVDAGGKLTKVVLESAKVRVTVERLPIPVYITGIATNVILTPNLIMTNVFKTNGLIQWLPGVQAVDLNK